LFDVAAEGTDLRSMDGRARFSKTAAPLIHQLPDGVFRSLMFDNLAKRTGLSLEVLSEFTKIPEEVAQIPQGRARDEEAGPSNTAPSRDAANPSVAEASGDGLQDIPDYLSADIPADLSAYDGIGSSYDNTGSPAYPDEAQHPLQQQLQTAPIYGNDQRGERVALRNAQQSNTRQSLPPAKRALLLLLDQPKLLAQSQTELSISDEQTHDADMRDLRDLIQYLKQRPEAEFLNILGYWGGSKGVDAQQAIAGLVAKHIVRTLKNIETYDPLRELEACLSELNAQNRKLSSKEELAKLSQKGLGQLSAEEKQRYLELIRSS
jgi:DNA primase